MKNKKLLLMVALSCAAGHGLHTFAAAEVTERQRLEWAYQSGEVARAQQILNRGMVSVQDAQWVLGRLLHFGIMGKAFDESRQQVADVIQKYIQERTDQEVAQQLQDEDQAAARERKRENQQREESDALIAQIVAAEHNNAAKAMAMRRGRAASPAAEEKEAEAVAHAFSFPMAPGGPGWAQQKGASCPACTFTNKPGAAKCEMCDNPFQ
ncbi:MAG: zinc finger Ran-binding domain-containing protein [Candidatus Dependentiae bacterium]|nr:zinc finger Ran-binding domain-containing protein [Candidatus Dependentiae bacterium]